MTPDFEMGVIGSPLNIIISYNVQEYEITLYKVVTSEIERFVYVG